MHWSRYLLALGITGVLILTPPPATAADAAPVIAVLEYSHGLLFDKTADISAVSGTTASPFAGRPKVVWTLREGKTIVQPTRPADHIIQFYTLSGKDPVLVCTVAVTYTTGAKGWRPGYQLLPAPTATWNGTKLVPMDPGLQGSVQAVPAGTATNDGFTHSLSFGSTMGPLAIDFWDVQ